METDAGSVSQGGTPTPEEEHQNTDVGLEAGQIEADGEAETGMVDGETDADGDLDVVV